MVPGGGEGLGKVGVGVVVVSFLCNCGVWLFFSFNTYSVCTGLTLNSFILFSHTTLLHDFFCIHLFFFSYHSENNSRRYTKQMQLDDHSICTTWLHQCNLFVAHALTFCFHVCLLGGFVHGALYHQETKTFTSVFKVLCANRKLKHSYLCLKCCY